ncbi:hypothetical protein VUJ46_01450 [Chryseobacterium sp. MYb264]|uniref:hypothetical protein n=1 Tax=Chryseobacterium sp. MYb264 TaxID=2745153 RepID=UPI002E157844|nr:hypothetical protein VUJ46_01450 [Chryseobacterium sp. MYb264]
MKIKIKKRRLPSGGFTLLLILLTLSCRKADEKKTGFQNDLKNTRWIVDSGGIIGAGGDSVYYLSRRIDSLQLFNFHAIDFLDEEKFTSYDSWECGNDCFTRAFGRYYFTGNQKVIMEIDSISTIGTCMAPTRIFEPSETRIFDLSREGKGLIFRENKSKISQEK